MTDVFIGINKGLDGFKHSDFTIGTSTGSTDIELRIADGAAWSRIEIYKALEAFDRLVQSNGFYFTQDQVQGG